MLRSHSCQDVETENNHHNFRVESTQTEQCTEYIAFIKGVTHLKQDLSLRILKKFSLKIFHLTFYTAL